MNVDAKQETTQKNVNETNVKNHPAWNRRNMKKGKIIKL